MSTLLKRAREALEGVPPGPWSVYSGHYVSIADRLGINADSEALAAFIAAARTLVPELADELERTQSEAESANYLWKEARAECAIVDAKLAEAEKRLVVAVKVVEWTLDHCDDSGDCYFGCENVGSGGSEPHAASCPLHEWLSDPALCLAQLDAEAVEESAK